MKVPGKGAGSSAGLSPRQQLSQPGLGPYGDLTVKGLWWAGGGPAPGGTHQRDSGSGVVASPAGAAGTWVPSGIGTAALRPLTSEPLCPRPVGQGGWYTHPRGSRSPCWVPQLHRTPPWPQHPPELPAPVTREKSSHGGRGSQATSWLWTWGGDLRSSLVAHFMGGQLAQGKWAPVFGGPFQVLPSLQSQPSVWQGLIRTSVEVTSDKAAFE